MSLLNPALEAFIEITVKGTVQGAAQSLGITQTGVTQRIRSLESQLSATLFVRSRRGMSLTDEGRALLKYCVSARELEGITLASLSRGGIQAERHLSVLGPTSLMRSRVVPHISELTKNFPELSVSIEISDNKDGVQALKNGEVHLAVLSRENVSLEMDSKILKPERYLLVGPKKWSQRPLREILEQERLIDFGPEDMTSMRYLEKFNLRHHVKKARHYINSNEGLLELFSKGVGYGVLTEEFVESFSSKGTLSILNEGKILENRLALAWYPRPYAPAYFTKIIGAIA